MQDWVFFFILEKCFMAIKVAATSNIWVTRFFKLSTQLLFSMVTDTPDEIC